MFLLSSWAVPTLVLLRGPWWLGGEPERVGEATCPRDLTPSPGDDEAGVLLRVGKVGGDVDMPAPGTAWRPGSLLPEDSACWLPDSRMSWHVPTACATPDARVRRAAMALVRACSKLRRATLGFATDWVLLMDAGPLPAYTGLMSMPGAARLRLPADGTKVRSDGGATFASALALLLFPSLVGGGKWVGAGALGSGKEPALPACPSCD